MSPVKLSRQMVLFCIERRKAWRYLQGRAGIENPDYAAQKATLAAIDADDFEGAPLLEFARDRFSQELAVLTETS